MRRILFFITLAGFTWMVSCGGSRQEQKPEGADVVITTKFGEIKLMLYDETPEHKKNFLKLIDEGFYNDLLFHRVIENFMIQGGDPMSRKAGQNFMLGGNDLGYTIPAEIVPTYYHKRGALAAARTGNQSNPERRSSGSQFYIVQGEVYTPGQLDTIEMKINFQRKDEMLKKQLNEVKDTLIALRQLNDRESFEKIVGDIRIRVDSVYDADHKFELTEEQRKVYTTIGGYPSLDGEYTVFGEMTEGWNVLDSIAAVKTNKQNRPLEDVKMKIKVLN
jgi:peptidyl-prolyl cis-trans isomerase B (cyclophilin B)